MVVSTVGRDGHPSSRVVLLKGFDTNGNFSVGLREHLIFPEISGDEIENIHGLELAINTTAKNRDEAFLLLSAFGFPFKKTKGVQPVR